MANPGKSKDPAAVKRGRSARVKGSQAEREVCAILARLTGRDFQRILGQARDSGSDVEYGPFLLEIKRQERLKMSEFQQQACESAKLAGKLPAVVYRQSRQAWWISLPLEEFVTLLEALKNGQRDA